MTNNNKNIDYYFSVAKQAPVTIPIEKINLLISQKAASFKVKSTKSIINIKYIIMTTLGIITTTVAVIVSLNLMNKSENFQKKSETPKCNNAQVHDVDTSNVNELVIDSKAKSVEAKTLELYENQVNSDVKDVTIEVQKPLVQDKDSMQAKQFDMFSQYDISTKLNKEIKTKIIDYKNKNNKYVVRKSGNGTGYVIKQNKLGKKKRKINIDLTKPMKPNMYGSIIEKDGLFGYVDKVAGAYVKPQFDRIDSFGIFIPDWALVSKDGLFGFIDVFGKEVVPVKYDKIDSFGVFQKHWARVQKDGLFGFIDVFGNEVVKVKYDEIFDFDVYRKSWALVKKDGLLGFIDVFGNELVKVKYDEIFDFDVYRESWALVKKDGLLGFINVFGNEVVKVKYDEIYPFGIYKNDGKEFDKNKQIKVRGEYSADWTLVKKDGLFGFIDIFGNEIVKPQYDQIEKFDSLKKTAKAKRDGEDVFIDVFGKEVN